MDYETRIQSLNLVLPEPPKPAGSYQPVVIAGECAYLSGQISKTKEGIVLAGKAGEGTTLEEAKKAAQAAALNVLSVLRHYVGFSKFRRMLRLVGYVQTAPDFYEISSVVNGASDLFLQIFGDNGVHARSAVGMSSLPMNALVELEVTVQVRP